MKYSLIWSHPDSNASVAAAIRSSSVTPLLMMSRMRCVPASGANVSPVRRDFSTSRARAIENESTRREGNDTATP